eukprot:gene5286-biopygen19216
MLIHHRLFDTCRECFDWKHSENIVFLIYFVEQLLSPVLCKVCQALVTGGHATPPVAVSNATPPPRPPDVVAPRPESPPCSMRPIAPRRGERRRAIRLRVTTAAKTHPSSE